MRSPWFVVVSAAGDAAERSVLNPVRTAPSPRHHRAITAAMKIARLDARADLVRTRDRFSKQARHDGDGGKSH